MSVSPGSLVRPLRFCIVGLANTAVDLVVFVTLLQLGFALLAANAVAYLCASLNSFTWNRNWTFAVARRREPIPQRLFLFLCANTIGLLLSTACLWILSFFISPYLAKLVSVAVVLVWNYLAAARIFRAPASPSADACGKTAP